MLQLPPVILELPPLVLDLRLTFPLLRDGLQPLLLKGVGLYSLHFPGWFCWVVPGEAWRSVAGNRRRPGAQGPAGGGIPGGRAFKAVQTGGPSGGCITEDNLNVHTDYESLTALGAIMGSGGLIAMDEDTCMVDMARYFMDFVQDESCGKCVACRIGTKRMLEILERITKGEGKEGDIELLEELGATIKETAICGLGQTAPNPVLSMIHNFRHEFEEHIKNKYCRAGVCSELFISPCENTCPANVNVPGYLALISVGRFVDAYNLIRQENPFPAVCGRICNRRCEDACMRGEIDLPIAIDEVKKFVAVQLINRINNNHLEYHFYCNK